MPLPIKNVDFVEMSDLFEGCQGAWMVFSNSDPNCSWGDNNRTFINASYIASIISGYEDDDEEIKKQIETVLKRIAETSPTDFYVDLEN